MFVGLSNRGMPLGSQVFEKLGIIIPQWFNLSNPVSRFTRINEHRSPLVIGTHHKLGKEVDFVTVFTFRLSLVSLGCAQVLQPFRILTPGQQSLVNHHKQFTRPVGIEFAAEVLVGVERSIILEYGF